MRGQGTDTARTCLPAAPRILLLRLDNIGDVVLLAPAVAAMRAAQPDAHLTLLTSPAGAQGAALVPGLDEVIAHRASWQQLTAGTVDPEAERGLIGRLREGAYDAAIVFTSFSQDPVAPAYACYLAGIPIRAAFAPPLFAGEVITHTVPVDGVPDHQAERAHHLVRALGFGVPRSIEARDTALYLQVPPDAVDHAERLLRATGLDGVPFVALVPGASAPARRYAPERFAAVARQLAREGLPVAVLGSDREVSLAGEIEAEAGALSVVSLAGRTSVPVMAAVIARAALAITNNSLALHLADGLGVPVASTYAGTDPLDYWRPRAAPGRLLTREIPCAPCFLIECDRGHECLDIEPREVVLAAEALLAPVGVGTAERESA